MSQTKITLDPPPQPDYSHLYKTTEGRILIVGIAIALAGVIAMAAVAYWSVRDSRMIGAMAFGNIVFGRAVSMAIGYAGGYGHAVVIPVNIWAETVLVLLFYPLFVLSMRRLVEFRWLKTYLDRVHAAAERHHDTVRRFGIAGLFAFVWSPFWMTGPVVACAIGYLLGFPTWLTLLVVLLGTSLAVITWGLLLDDVFAQASVLAPWAPLLVIGLLIAALITAYTLRRRRKNKRG